MLIKNLFRIALATFGLTAASMAQSAICQFIPTSGNWDVPANWANCTGGNGVPANTPGPADRAEITGKTAILPAGVFNVGDIYVGAATIQGAGIGTTVLNVQNAGGIAWGSGFYTFQSLTINFTSSGNIPAANGPLTVDTAEFTLQPGVTAMTADTITITGVGAKIKNGGIFNPSTSLTILGGGAFENMPGGAFSPVTAMTINGTAGSFVNKGNFILPAGLPITWPNAPAFSQPVPSGGISSTGVVGIIDAVGQTFQLDSGFVSGSPNFNVGTLLNNGAIIAPGVPGQIGTITVNGNYVNANNANARLAIDVTFNSTVISNGALLVSGTATLNGGGVDFYYTDIGFGPYNTTQGDVISFITAGNVVLPGFSGFSAPATANSTSINYTATQAQLVVGPLIPATLTVSPPALSFGSQPVALTSPPLVMTVTNPTNGTIFFSNFVSTSAAFNTDWFPPIAPPPSESTPQRAGVAPQGEAGNAAAGTGSGVGAGSSQPGKAPALSIKLARVGGSPLPNATRPSNPSCGGTIAALASCDVNVFFTPSAIGPVSGVIEVHSDSPGVATVAVDGAGIAATPADISVTGSTTFPTTAVGANSGVQFITITNTGSLPLNLTSLAASNPLVFSDTVNGPPPQSAQWCHFGSDTMGFPLPGAVTLLAFTSCDLVLTFKPTLAQTYNETITISSNAASGATKVINLTGVGAVGATATLAPDPLNFGSVPVSTTSAPLTATFTNTSATPLTLASIGVGPGFNVTGGTCAVSNTIPPSGGTCTVTVTATPPVTGNIGSALQISTTPLSNNPQVVLQVTGAAPVITLSADPIVIGATPVGWTRAAFVTVSNSSASAVTFTPIPPAASQFSVGVNQVPVCSTGTIPASGSCDLIFNFTPTATGPFSGTFTLNTSAGNISAPISGTGIATLPFPTVAPASLSYAGQALNTSSSPQSFTFSSPVSGVTLQFQTLGGITGTNPADFTLGTDGCANQFIPAGSNCGVQVIFSPTSGAGAKSASVTYLAVEPSGSFYGIGGTMTGTALPAVTTPVITSAVNATGTVGVPFTYTITAANTPTSFGATSLPPGLTVNTATGVISGTPTTAGTYTATISATNVAGTGSSLLGFTITAAPIAAVTLSTSLVTFAAQTVNTTSPPQVVTLTNSGTNFLIISSISIAGDYGFTSNCPLFPSTLAAGASCNISATFTPLTVARLAGTITIANNAPGNPHTVALDGSGVAAAVPVVTTDTNSLVFNATTVGTSSAAQTVLLTNNGFSNLNISSIVVSGPFSRLTGPGVARDCGTVLAPSANCLITLVFNPTIVGVATGSVVITHSATPSTTTVALTGTGATLPTPIIAVIGGLAFGDQLLNATASQVLNITNIGTTALRIGSVTLSGANAANFRVAGTCTSLLAGETCSLNVSFIPTSVGPKTAQIAIVSNSGSTVPTATPATTSNVALSGNGILSPVPVATLNLSTIGFGNAIFGGASNGQAVTLTNTGGVSLNISTIVTSADFLLMNNCGGVLASLASCTINVSFSPLGTGPRLGDLQVFSNAAGSPHKVSLSGTGCRWFSQAQSRFFLTSC